MNRILIIGLFAMLPMLLTAQDSEIGLIFGASGYSGDLTPNTNIYSTGQNHASLGIFGRVDLNNYFAGRASFLFGKISGADSRADNADLRARNLSFQSTITELAIVGEFNPLGTNSRGARMQPYLYAGIAGFHFRPEANFGGQLVELQPLGTEGQGMAGFESKYRLTQISIPLGVGVKFRATERINIGLDIGLRKTFTDYLDDVSGTYVSYSDLASGNGFLAASLGNREGELIGEGTEPVLRNTGDQRGGATKNDWYYNAGVTVSYRFFGKTRNFKGRNPTGREFGCPTGL